jgi:hypothetical protein
MHRVTSISVVFVKVAFVAGAEVVGIMTSFP